MNRKPRFEYFPSTWFEEHYGIPFAENSDMRGRGHYLQCPCGRRHLKPARDGQPLRPWGGRELRYLSGMDSWE
eukprot:2362800-Lingulodinium_polyedra.AAC.1